MAQDRRTIRRIQLAHDVLRIAHRRGWKTGHHLTEHSLVDALGVSRSPVRSALDLLESWGAVTNRPNHGYRLAKDADALLSLGDEVPQSTDEELYISLVDARLNGDLPDTITQAEIIQRFAASRMLVDRVLDRMAEEGLVERLKGRGWRFQQGFDNSVSWESGYQLRLTLEPASILLPQFAVDLTWLNRMRLAHLDLSTATKANRNLASWTYSIDAEFHEMIAAFSGNPFFLQAIQHQNRLRRLLEYRGYSNQGRIDDWCAEHLAIIDALEQGAFEQASALMRTHLERASDATGHVIPSTQ